MVPLSRKTRRIASLPEDERVRESFIKIAPFDLADPRWRDLPSAEPAGRGRTSRSRRRCRRSMRSSSSKSASTRSVVRRFRPGASSRRRSVTGRHRGRAGGLRRSVARLLCRAAFSGDPSPCAELDRAGSRHGQLLLYGQLLLFLSAGGAAIRGLRGPPSTARAAFDDGSALGCAADGRVLRSQFRMRSIALRHAVKKGRRSY